MLGLLLIDILSAVSFLLLKDQCLLWSSNPPQIETFVLLPHSLTAAVTLANIDWISLLMDMLE